MKTELEMVQLEPHQESTASTKTVFRAGQRVGWIDPSKLDPDKQTLLVEHKTTKGEGPFVVSAVKEGDHTMKRTWGSDLILHLRPVTGEGRMVMTAAFFIPILIH